MILDPAMAMIRTSGVGIEFYDRVMDRMAARTRRPRGVAVHFAGLCDGEINVATIYRDTASRTDVFADFSGPEIANAQAAGPERSDISRDEFDIDRLIVADELTRTAERPVERPLVAYIHIEDDTPPEQYEEICRQASFPENWPAGMLLHTACRHDRTQVVIDLWATRGDAEAFYSRTIQPIAARITDRAATDMATSDRAIEIHALTVALDADDPLRDYSRQRI